MFQLIINYLVVLYRKVMYCPIANSMNPIKKFFPYLFFSLNIKKYLQNNLIMRHNYQHKPNIKFTFKKDNENLTINSPYSNFFLYLLAINKWFFIAIGFFIFFQCP